MDFSLATHSNYDRTFLKQCRSISELEEQETSSGILKLARTSDSSYSSCRAQQQQQLLQLQRSTSSSPGAVEEAIYEYHQLQSGAAGFITQHQQQQQQFYQQSPRNGGANFYPFTASQWAELEHQALIFKYMMARAAVPQELLNPIRRSVAAMSSRFGGLAAGSFQLGVTGSPMDSEPGRCRRTDGKKWRCSRPVVPDQKYCERHIHRGRHRSKKAVEAAAAAAAAQAQQQRKLSSNGATVKSAASSISSCLSFPGGFNHQQQQQQQRQFQQDHRLLDHSKAPQFDIPPDQKLFSELSGSTRKLATPTSGCMMIMSKSNDSSSSSNVARSNIPANALVQRINYNHHHHQEVTTTSTLAGLEDEQVVIGGNGSSMRELGIWFPPENPTSKPMSPLRHFIDNWPRTSDPWPEDDEDGGSKINNGSSLDNNVGCEDKSLKLCLEEEDSTRIGLGSGRTSFGPLAEALRQKHTLLASPTGVLQKVSCFSDSSSSAVAGESEE